MPLKSLSRPVRVLKFGGTSLGSADRIEDVVGIISSTAAEARTLVVVSAIGGVTNKLLEAARTAAQGDSSYRELLGEVLAAHEEPRARLVREEDRVEVEGVLDAWTQDLEDRLQGVSLVRECSPRILDSVLAFGELASSTLVCAALRQAGVDSEACDIRKLILTDQNFGAATVERDETDRRLLRQFATADAVQVVPGFIAGTDNGETTTLGRGGSDYSAALIGAALGAERVEIWTDVDGVMSADPRLVPRAFSLPGLSYEELMELSHFGAKVVFPPSVHPARERGVPLFIKNTLNPDFPGTRVLPDRPADREHPIRGISSINNVALLRLEGDGMIGVPGIAERLFGALARGGISVVLISQASSERSICFAVEPHAVSAAAQCVNDEFRLERKLGTVDDLVVEEGRSVIAAVGEGMRDTPGIAGRLFSVLGRAQINVRAIAQGSSELNISLVVAREDEERALRTLHDAFFLPETRAVQVYVLGTGRVGGALLEQLNAERQNVVQRRGLDLTLAGVANTRRGVVDAEGIAWDGWRERLERSDAGLEDVVEVALKPTAGLRVLVDCTANDATPGHYVRLLRAGVSVVTPNKRAFSGSSGQYRELVSSAHSGRGLYFETTVGAGLPILRTVADLVTSGDEIVRIEGVLSGTLAYLFDRIMDGDDLSAAVRAAHERGYTEPDPREDLAGTDVQRKLVILARQAGFQTEPHDVRIDPVLPGQGWSELSLEAFWETLANADEELRARREEARTRGHRLCYLAAVDADGASVGITGVPDDHPCAGLRGADNLVAITTRRYPSPLVIRGAGAGPEVTAAGVFADILRAAMESR